MHQLLHDYFWIYVVIVVVIVGALFYFTPKLMRRLEKIIERRLRGEEKSVAGKPGRARTFETEKNRYRSF